MSDEPSKATIAEMARMAWHIRARSRLIGKTAVGAVVLSTDGKMWGGCNVEHKFRSHDIHAETNAIGTMIAGGSTGIETVLVAAERDRFTPCGACLDWIFEFASSNCRVYFQSAPGAELVRYMLDDLMPFYPK